MCLFVFETGFVMGKDDKYAEELEVAVRVVIMVCSLCQRLQQKLVSDSGGGGHVKSKDDDSPVTVAGLWILIFNSTILLCFWAIFLFNFPDGLCVF